METLAKAEEERKTRQMLLFMGISLGINSSVKGLSLENVIKEMKLGSDIEVRHSNRENMGKA